MNGSADTVWQTDYWCLLSVCEDSLCAPTGSVSCTRSPPCTPTLQPGLIHYFDLEFMYYKLLMLFIFINYGRREKGLGETRGLHFPKVYFLKCVLFALSRKSQPLWSSVWVKDLWVCRLGQCVYLYLRQIEAGWENKEQMCGNGVVEGWPQQKPDPYVDLCCEGQQMTSVHDPAVVHALEHMSVRRHTTNPVTTSSSCYDNYVIYCCHLQHVL